MVTVITKFKFAAFLRRGVNVRVEFSLWMTEYTQLIAWLHLQLASEMICCYNLESHTRLVLLRTNILAGSM